MIQYVFKLFSLLVFLYLACSAVYLLIMASAGKWIKGISSSRNPSRKKIAVLIPSFKEDGIIIDTAVEAVAHNYPPELFTVLIIADKLQQDTIQKLKSIPVAVLEVEFDVSMKAKSLYEGLKFLRTDNFDIALVLDADNIMDDGCLESINAVFQNGCLAVQCHRIAKNKDRPVALLDAISEEVNINILRRGPAVLGLSAAPSGSGMAFDYNLLLRIFADTRIHHNPAEDREIDMQLMKRKIRIEFLNDVYIFDEKVEDAGVFKKQRIRWLEAQIHHIRRFFDADMRNAPRTAVYYHKFFQNFLLPRILFLIIFAAIIILLMLQWYTDTLLLYPDWEWWLACTCVYFFVVFISIPSIYYNLKTVKAVFYIPVLMLSMVEALFQIKKDRKEFLHTRKTVTTK